MSDDCLPWAECSDCGEYVDKDELDPETGQCKECVEDTDE